MLMKTILSLLDVLLHGNTALVGLVVSQNAEIRVCSGSFLKEALQGGEKFGTGQSL